MENANKKMNMEQLEIYKQRYETFRHLDKLRWQMLQIAVATGSLVLVFGKDGSKPEWWVWVAIGMILLILGFAMMQIGNGIRKNGKVLHNAGNAIGDVNIPKQLSNWRSISFWIALIMIVVGFVSLALSIYYLMYTI